MYTKLIFNKANEACGVKNAVSRVEQETTQINPIID